MKRNVVRSLGLGSMEVLKPGKSLGESPVPMECTQIAVATWKRHLREHHAEVFGGKEDVKLYEKTTDLERMLGKKHVEIALSKTSWAIANCGIEHHTKYSLEVFYTESHNSCGICP